MRLATIVEAGRPWAALVDGPRLLPLAMADPALRSVRGIAAGGPEALMRIGDWASGQPDASWRPLQSVEFAPAVPDPGAIYTIGLNYRAPDEADGDGPERPLVYGKGATSVSGHGAVVGWDRSLTANVDAECELGVVIGETAEAVGAAEALGRIFGYTVMNDISSRDPWLDGDQWLLGKSMPGFCPVGPWVVTADELDPADLRLGCTINGEPIQDGRTSWMRHPIAEIVSYLSRHVVLRPGDLIATGTPDRLDAPPGPFRRLRAGDVVTAWIERIGDLTTTIA